jgi:sec-independent protein translocase protein TatB
MFDVSFTELMVIGVVALVVIGPERLPKVARTLGHLVGRAQRYVNDVKADIQREVELDELRKFKDQVKDAAQTVHQSINESHAAISDPLKSFEQNTMAALNTSAPDAGLAEAEATNSLAPKVHVSDSASASAQAQAAEPTLIPQASPITAQTPIVHNDVISPNVDVSKPTIPLQLEIDALSSTTEIPATHHSSPSSGARS